ncbi:Cysteine-rich receptor-like protein kinase 7 [Triticum urartu]|uniref:Cysteine-rich receptor-like protein kinase 7 n=1 Tax=Triticum urartu TaxID=4572 RepID=M7ZIW9_TRIUA|nr:Cysteine-rich receptor-like protein kinase 7 [Triticum urartu]
MAKERSLVMQLLAVLLPTIQLAGGEIAKEYKEEAGDIVEIFATRVLLREYREEIEDGLATKEYREEAGDVVEILATRVLSQEYREEVGDGLATKEHGRVGVAPCWAQLCRGKRQDTSKSAELDWNSRHNIIIGIAHGLLYLHEDSLLKVIHRDLKPSNVLLDNKMNPKISDFGLARIFKDECNGVNTGHIVGTYGYMAPEFVMDSVFSAKSDVFGFGVLLLEILSGQRNGMSYLEEHRQSLIQDAWKFWIEDRANEFIDRALGQSYSRDEAWRCFQVGLLCVQDDPDIRPTMSNVLLMLVSEQMSLPAPSRPVVRSPGYDHEHDEESRNGRDIKIDILDDYVWTSEWFWMSSGIYRSTGRLPEPPRECMGLSGREKEAA